MLNTGDSLSKRSYADFSIEYLLSKDYNQSGGTLRHSSNLPKSENYSNYCLHSEVNSQLNGSLQTQTSSDLHSDKDSMDGDSYFPWLSCTRFKPPKLTRSRRRSASKRSGRGPRIPFSTHQLAILERTFMTSQYLSSKAIANLAESLQLTEVRVKIWFQNRRARYRRESEQSTSTPNPTGIKSRTPQSPMKASPYYDPKTFPSGGHPHIPHPNPSSTSLSKQSFRHLINDLNLMTANVSSSTSSAYLDACRNHFTSPNSSISKESCA